VVRSAGLGDTVRALGEWSTGTGTLHRQLGRALAAAIERGELSPGSRLPSERSLATAVSVSRGVVVAAYDGLVDDGLVQRRRGNGTFVAGGSRALPPGREGSALVAQLVDQGSAPSLIDLSISVLHEAAGLPAVAIDAAGLVDVGADSPWGLPDLRARIASRLCAIGLPTSVEQVVVTTGAQQGIATAVGCWVRPGDVVVVDDPTYPGVLASCAAAGATVRPVPVDRHGIVLEHLAHALDEGPALIYVQSGPHSPTGARLSRHRREVIARWAVERRVPLVEDVALVALDWSQEPTVAPLASFAPDHPIAVVGSYSKRFWAGLRVGFVRAPEPVARRLVRVKATQDLGSSSVSQAMALGLLDHRDHQGFVGRRNGELAARAAHLIELLAAHLPSWSCSAPRGGLSLWVRLPTPDASRLAAAGLRHGVAVATPDGLSATPVLHADRIRLTFAAPRADLIEGVRRLAAAWAEISQ